MQRNGLSLEASTAFADLDSVKDAKHLLLEERMTQEIPFCAKSNFTRWGLDLCEKHSEIWPHSVGMVSSQNTPAVSLAAQPPLATDPMSR